MGTSGWAQRFLEYPITSSPANQRACLMVRLVKNLPAIQETQVLPLDQEDPLEKGMATRCSTLAWRSPWTGESSGLQSMRPQRVRLTEWLTLSLLTDQKKVTHLAALTQNFAYKNLSLKTIGEFWFFEQELPILLAWPCNKPLSASNFDISICPVSLCIQNTNLNTVTVQMRRREDFVLW